MVRFRETKIWQFKGEACNPAKKKLFLIAIIKLTHTLVKTAGPLEEEKKKLKNFHAKPKWDKNKWLSQQLPVV
jgi:hypothetical protein